MASPFLTELARQRATTVLAFAGVTGSAMIVSALGEIVLAAGTTDIDTAHIARVVAERVRSRDDVLSFSHASACVHATAIASGYALCVISTMGNDPRTTLDRIERARHVLALALVHGSHRGAEDDDRSGSSGAPAAVRVKPS